MFGLSSNPSRDRWLKRIALAVAVGAVWLAALSGYRLAERLSVDAMRREIVNALARVTGGQVRLREFHWGSAGRATLRGLVLRHWTQPRCHVHEVRIDRVEVTLDRPRWYASEVVVRRIHVTGLSADVGQLPPEVPWQTGASGSVGDTIRFDPQAEFVLDDAVLAYRARDMWEPDRRLVVHGLSARANLERGSRVVFEVTARDPDLGDAQATGHWDLGARTGLARVRVTKLKITPATVRLIPVYGPAVARAWGPRGEVAGTVLVEADAATPDGGTVSARADRIRLGLQPARLEGGPVQFNGDVRLGAERLYARLRGIWADGRFEANGTVDWRAPGCPFSVIVEHTGQRLGLVVGRPDVRGEMAGRCRLTGRLDDAGTLSGTGSLAIASAHLSPWPLFREIADGVSLAPGDRAHAGQADIRYTVGGLQAVVTHARLITPALAAVSTGGCVAQDRTVDLGVLAVRRRVDAKGVPIVGGMPAWPRRVLLRHLVRMHVQGSLDVPKRTVVPVGRLDPGLEQFFKSQLCVKR